MAVDVISIGILKSLINGLLVDTNQQNNFKVDQATANRQVSSPTVTTGDTLLPVTGIGVLGWAFIKNLDPTNFVNVGPEAAGAIVPLLQVRPGEEIAFRLVPGTVVRWQADTDPVQVDLTLYED